MSRNCLTVFCTVPDEETAEKIADAVVASKTAACASIIPGLLSVYRWKGEIRRDAELLLVMKTTEEKFPSLREEILSLHPYELPEIVAIPIAAGYDNYLAWIEDSTAL